MGNKFIIPETRVDVTIDIGDCMAIMVIILILALLLFTHYCEEGLCRPIVDMRDRFAKPDILKDLEIVETKSAATA